MAAGGKKSSKEFKSSPFKQLKGLSVAAEGKKDRPAPADKKTSAVDLSRAETDFTEEMARLGVERLDGKKAETKVLPLVDKEPTGSEEGGAPAAPSDQELFLAALGELEAVFQDELPEPAEPPRPSARRRRLLRQGKLQPQGTLDLHGKTRTEARQQVGFFLENARFQRWQTVLIITGRGRGSAGEPVLRLEVERFLAREAADRVAEWGTAPGRLGGEGALVVFLKK